MTDNTPDRSKREGIPQVFKIQNDLSGNALLIYNEDRSLFKKIDDPAVASFLLEILEIDKPLAKRYAQGRMMPVDGELTFRVDEVLSPSDWPSW